MQMGRVAGDAPSPVSKASQKATAWSYLEVEGEDSSTLGRAEAGSWGHGRLPRRSGGAPGCVAAAWALGGTGRADGAVSSNSVEAVFHRPVVQRLVGEAQLAPLHLEGAAVEGELPRHEHAAAVATLDGWWGGRDG